MHALINCALFSVIFMRFSKEKNTSETKHLLETSVHHSDKVTTNSNYF